MDKQEIIEEVLNVMLKKVNETKEEYESYVAYNLYSENGVVDGYGTGFRAGVNEGMARLMVAVAREYNSTVIENKDKPSVCGREVSIYSEVALTSQEMQSDFYYMSGLTASTIRFIRPEIKTKIEVDWENRRLLVGGKEYFVEVKNETCSNRMD